METPSPDFDPSLLPAEPPAWPKVVGITSLVWGIVLMGCGALGLAWMAAAPWLASMAEKEMGGPLPEVMHAPVSIMVLTGFGLLWDVLLLTAGVMTLRRNPGGRALHLLWAAVAVAVGIVHLFIARSWQADMAQWAEQNPGKWADQVRSPGNTIGMAIGFVIGFGWPAFCLVWFGLVKRDAADMGVPNDPLSA